MKNLKLQVKLFAGFGIVVITFILSSTFTYIAVDNAQGIVTNLRSGQSDELMLLEQLKTTIDKSSEYTFNWVYVGTKENTKELLRGIHGQGYDSLKTSLTAISAGWANEAMKDSLNGILGSYDEIISNQASIMSSLSSFESYNDPLTMFEAEDIMESTIAPATEVVINQLEDLIAVKTTEAATLQFLKSSIALKS